MTTTNSTIFCNFCERMAPQTYSLYRLILKTDKGFYEIGFKTLIEGMNDWIMKKSYFLSPTEIILMRPDLLFEYLRTFKKDEVVENWLFADYHICMKCYETYKTAIPER